MDPAGRHVRVAIVGSGFAGLGAAIRLRQAGITDLVIIEQAGTVGGVWRDNVYPGCACDVESHLYELSCAPNPEWSQTFAPSGEIQAYLERVAGEFGLRPLIAFGTRVEEARWDTGALRWRLATTRGEVTADLLVIATGALSSPAVPELPGLAEFGGPVWHSARWNAAADLRGRRVAVVGTGASAVQIIPAIQPVVSRLTVFQRTPGWVIPRRNRPISEGRRRFLARHPGWYRAQRRWVRFRRELLGVPFRHPAAMRGLQWVATHHLRRSIADPALRAKLTPRFVIGCKRIMLSDDYYPALAAPNVEVVAGAVTGFRPGAVLGPDGREHPADAVVFCTGFEVTEFPMSRHIRGRSGRTLAESWGASPRAHLGTTVPGFPNLFLLQGPNTGLGHTSVLLMAEAQIEHVVNAACYLRDRAVAAVEPTEAAEAAFVSEVDRRMAGTVWVTGGCRSWYLDRTGRNSTLWPGTTGEFHRRVAPFDPAEYHGTAAPS